jgi:hypothetical protein
MVKPPSLMLKITIHPPSLVQLAELCTPRMEAARFWDLDADDGYEYVLNVSSS